MSTAETPTRADAALQLAGVFRVFPVGPGGKSPLSGVKWDAEATHDPERIRQWWKAHPNANIGVACGASKRGVFLVLDVDGPEGAASLEAVEKEHGPLPATFRVQTPKGRHIYLIGGPVRNRVRVAPGLDLRSEGGYVVGPFSTGPGGKPYTVAQDEPLAAAPEWLIALAGSPREKAEDRQTPAVEPDAAGSYERAAEVVKLAPPTKEGSRNHDTYRVAAAVFDQGVSESTGLQLMLDYNARSTPPLDHDELELVVASAYRNRSTPVGSGHPAAAFDEVPLPDPPQAEAPERRGLRLEAFGDVKPDLNRPHLVRDILHPGAFAVMFGPPNEGKTFTALDMAVAVATGRPWLGRPTEAGPVVYAALEGGGGIRVRLAGFRQHYDLEGQDVPLFLLAESLDLRSAKGHTEALVDALADVRARTGTGVALLVVDTLSRALAGGDENSSVDMGALVANLDRVRAATGAAVLVVHHVPRDAVRPRGHGSLDAAADTLLKVEKSGPVGKISTAKQRDMEYAPPIGFRLLPLDIGTDGQGRPVTSCIVEPADTPASAKPLKAGSRYEKALAVLARLVAEQGEHPEEMIPQALPVVPKDTWRAACSTEVFGGLSGETLRTSFNSVDRELGSRGYTVRHGDWRGVAPQ